MSVVKKPVKPNKLMSKIRGIDFSMNLVDVVTLATIGTLGITMVLMIFMPSKEGTSESGIQGSTNETTSTEDFLSLIGY